MTTNQIKFKYPLYVVVWDDAESEVTWQEEPLQPLEPSLCTSIGFLIRDEPDRILIADSYFPGTRTISNTIKIPRGMIKEMYEVRVSRKQERKKREKASASTSKKSEDRGRSEVEVEGSLQHLGVEAEGSSSEGTSS